MRTLSSLFVVVALTMVSAPSFAAKAGEITLLSGRATAATPEGVIRSLKKGDSVYSREFVNTASGSFVNIRFADGGAVLIKPDSRFLIEHFSMGGTAESAAAPKADDATAPRARTRPVAFFSLIKGGFRAVSGLIGKKDRNEYRISTPVATIGIRGTDYEAILCDEVCAKDPIVMENVGISTNPENGLVASVLSGGIGVTTKSTTAAATLHSYQAIARALGLAPTGLQKAAYRPQFIRTAAGVPSPFEINQGQTFFFPQGGAHPPIPLPKMNPNIDAGLQDYSPTQMCK